MNYVTQSELEQAKTKLASMSKCEVENLVNALAESRFSRTSVMIGDGSLAKCVVEGTGEEVDEVLFELAYRVRLNRLFKERTGHNLTGFEGDA